MKGIATMTAPQTPRKSALRDPVVVQQLIEQLQVIARDQRTMLLVDYLCDLRLELFWVADELAKLDFDAFAFLHELADADADDDEDDDDGLDPVEAD
jgi:hypothetical protein